MHLVSASSASLPLRQSSAERAAAPPQRAVPARALDSVALPRAPANQLITAGTLTICSDLPYPPQEYFDEDGTTAIGSDIDLAREIAARWV